MTWPRGHMGLEALTYLILAFEMASSGKQHFANCIGTLSFPITFTNGRFYFSPIP